MTTFCIAFYESYLSTVHTPAQGMPPLQEAERKQSLYVVQVAPKESASDSEFTAAYGG
jgi:hypothetical protein